MSITPEQREWRALMVDAVKETRTAITGINGSYSLTIVALRALDELNEIAIDDDLLGRCEMCAEPIWAIADETYAATDDGYFCDNCATLRAVTGELYADDDDDLDDEDASENPEEQENPT